MSPSVIQWFGGIVAACGALGAVLVSVAWFRAGWFTPAMGSISCWSAACLVVGLAICVAAGDLERDRRRGDR